MSEHQFQQQRLESKELFQNKNSQVRGQRTLYFFLGISLRLPYKNPFTEGV